MDARSDIVVNGEGTSPPDPEEPIDRTLTNVEGGGNWSRFVSATVSTTLSVPMANDWRNGVEIRDEQGNVRYVAKDWVAYIHASDNPMFAAKLYERSGEDDAIVYMEREIVNCLCTDTFVLYTSSSNYEGQQPDRQFDDGTVWYRHAVFTQTVFGKKYTLRYCEGENDLRVALKGTNGNIRNANLLLTLPLCCAKFTIHLYSPGDKQNAVITRNQKEETVVVAPGVRFVEAVFLAYAFDRLVLPYSSDMWRVIRQMCVKEVIAGTVTLVFTLVVVLFLVPE